MKFCIALVTYFNQIGFDTTDWRKSIDGTKAICHDEFIKVLVPGYLTDANITTYECPSDELEALLNGVDWYVAETV
jgi:hypothetical protein